MLNGCIPGACPSARHPDAAQRQASWASGCRGSGKAAESRQVRAQVRGGGGSPDPSAPTFGALRSAGVPPPLHPACPVRAALGGHTHTPPPQDCGHITPPRPQPARPAHQPPGSLAPGPQHAHCGHLTPETTAAPGLGAWPLPGHLLGSGKRTSP